MQRRSPGAISAVSDVRGSCVSSNFEIWTGDGQDGDGEGDEEAVGRRPSYMRCLPSTPVASVAERRARKARRSLWKAVDPDELQTRLQEAEEANYNLEEECVAAEAVVQSWQERYFTLEEDQAEKQELPRKQRQRHQHPRSSIQPHYRGSLLHHQASILHRQTGAAGVRRSGRRGTQASCGSLTGAAHRLSARMSVAGSTTSRLGESDRPSDASSRSNSVRSVSSWTLHADATEKLLCELEDAQRRTESVEEEVEVFQARQQSAEGEVTEAREACKMAKEQVRACKRELAEVRSKLDAEECSVVHLEAEAQDLRNALSAARRKNADDEWMLHLPSPGDSSLAAELGLQIDQEPQGDIHDALEEIHRLQQQLQSAEEQAVAFGEQEQAEVQEVQRLAKQNCSIAEQLEESRLAHLGLEGDTGGPDIGAEARREHAVLEEEARQERERHEKVCSIRDEEAKRAEAVHEELRSAQAELAAAVQDPLGIWGAVDTLMDTLSAAVADEASQAAKEQHEEKKASEEAAPASEDTSMSGAQQQPSLESTALTYTEAGAQRIDARKRLWDRRKQGGQAQCVPLTAAAGGKSGRERLRAKQEASNDYVRLEKALGNSAEMVGELVTQTWTYATATYSHDKEAPLIEGQSQVLSFAAAAPIDIRKRYRGARASATHQASEPGAAAAANGKRPPHVSEHQARVAVSSNASESEDPESSSSSLDSP